jgi:hypothetical protein
VDGVDDLGVVDSPEIGRSDPEIRVPELTLDDEQRHGLARHLDGGRVPELMGREATPHPGCLRGAA